MNPEAQRILSAVKPHQASRGEQHKAVKHLFAEGQEKKVRRY